jgi:nitroreductase/NAD-dependent dihydropyrimidine dehydrogenase PreA subunit
MANIVVDAQLCTKCGNCVDVCPFKVFKKNDGLPPMVVNESLCRNCGQCLAMCPTSAIGHPQYTPEMIHPIDFSRLPNIEQVSALMQARRSVRTFKNQPIDKGELERIISLASYAPNAQNAQSTEYIVVQDPKVLARIVEYSAESMGRISHRLEASPLPVRKVLKHFIGYQYYWLRDMQQAFKNASIRYELGEDMVFHRAPAVIFFTGCPKKTMAEVNAQLAIQNAILACGSMGLGCFYSGFVTSVAQWDNRIGKLIMLPPKRKLYGALAIGHPDRTFTKWIERKPKSITWI